MQDSDRIDADSIIGKIHTITLTANAILVSSSGDKMTATAPTSGYLTKMGVAISTTEFAIDINIGVKNDNS